MFLNLPTGDVRGVKLLAKTQKVSRHPGTPTLMKFMETARCGRRSPLFSYLLKALRASRYCIMQGWKLELAHLPRQASKHLGRLQIADFLLQFLMSLGQWRLLKELSFQPVMDSRPPFVYFR